MTQRASGQPRGVVLSSFLPQRPAQIARIIEIFSLLIDDGIRPSSAGAKMGIFKQFIDWADSTDRYDCLAGGAATVSAFYAWISYIEERFRRREIQSTTAHYLQKQVCNVLGIVAENADLGRGIRIIGANSSGRSVEPASSEDFSQTIVLNHAIFSGLCDFLLESRPFPFRLKMPKFLGCNDGHLWVFPGRTPYLAPHLLGAAREKLPYGRWAIDFENGRVVKLEEIQHRYDNKGHAIIALRKAAANLKDANENSRHWARVNLATFAKSAFLILFLANTGCNLAVALTIETDGEIDASTVNQTYRTIKFRARGKIISVISPASFMPALRKYLELRTYLLGDNHCPYLFFTLGHFYENKPSAQMRPQALEKHYDSLLNIYPKLPRLGAKKIRATVHDYYRRNYDRAVTARVMGHSEAVADKNYLAGSAVDHKTDLTQFFDQVARAASKQKVVSNDGLVQGLRKIEEGGRCSEFGRPEAIASDGVTPDCRQGCLFCTKRILVANEEDVRKVASAAFLMEQLISGPLSELEFRPQIAKCTADLDAIAAVKGCGQLVEWVKRDVFANGNLTPYFADKFQMFLELGVL